MSYDQRLKQEINQMLDRLAKRSSIWDAKSIAHAICNNHSDALAPGEEADFWRHAGYRHTRETVRKIINQRAGDRPDQDDGQLKLPGYDHLHAYYIVSRNGEDVGIPVYDMTDEEIEAKAQTYRSMAAACYAHADELDRFRTLRRQAA